MDSFTQKSLKILEILQKAAKDDTSEVATIAVCNGDSILMGKRRDNDRWTLPGGHLDKGEEKAEGAVRELFEESGIKVEPKDLEFLGTKKVTTYTGKNKIIHAFKYKHDGERPTTKHDPDKEVEKWEWIDVSKGIPTKIVENSQTPVDKNCIFEFMKLRPEEEMTKAEEKIYNVDEVVNHFKTHDTPGPHQERCEKYIRKYPQYRLATIDPNDTNHEYIDSSGSESQSMINDYTSRNTEPPAIIVHPDSSGDFSNNNWQIIDGVHRTKAAVINNKNRISAFIPIPSKVEKTEPYQNKRAGPKYHIHEEGHRITTEPLSVHEIRHKYGREPHQLESDGFRLVEHKDLDKSDYGPKKLGLYDPKVNVERKQGRIGTQAEGAGPNKEIKEIAPGGRQSGKAQAASVAAEAKRKSRKMPVKIYSPEDIAKLIPTMAPQKVKKYMPSMAASELEKGQQGDWKKEGYSLKYHGHKIQDKNKRTNNPGWIEHTITAHDRNDNEVGRYEFADFGEGLYPNATGTHPDHRRKGLANAAYRMIEEKTNQKLSQPQGSESQSDDAKKLWSQSNRPFSKSEMKRHLENTDALTHDWRQGYLQHGQPRKEVQPAPQGLDIMDGLRDMLVRFGKMIIHPKRGHVWNRKIQNKGDGQPLMRAEPPPTKLVHYSRITGLKNLDPNFQGTGFRDESMKRRGKPVHPVTYYYTPGSEGQDDPGVVSNAKSKYTVTLHPGVHKLYDLAHDKDKIVQNTVKGNQGAWDRDMIEGNIKAAGYHGYHNTAGRLPGAVALFHPHPVDSEEVLNG